MRKKHFDSADELREIFDLYIDSCKKRKEIPSLAGFAVEQGTTTSTLYTYRKEHHPFSEVMDYIFDHFQFSWIHNGKLSDRMKEFLLKSHIPETYTERRVTLNNNVNNNLEINEDQLTDTELKARLDELSSKLQNLSSLTTPTT